MEQQKQQGIAAGHIHPLSHMIHRIREIFAEIGFVVAEGPEVETEYYNFDALNVPPEHPARDMQDTFWVKAPAGTDERGHSTRRVLRTHTSPVQIRYAESHTPPMRIIVPGKVFRNEATDATHEAQFYQVEGMLIDRTTSLAELKGTLTFFFQKLFGADVQLRFRPSFFPFTEPSVEIDILFRGKWLEVMGGGLMNTKVIEATGLNPAEWQGFAFGGGIDRLAMIYYNIDDVRLLYSGDLRLVNQF